MSLIAFILIGAIAGWFAGQVMKGAGFGLLMNIVLGIVGSVVGGWLFDLFDVQTFGGAGGEFITATFGAIIVLFIAKQIKK